MIGKRGTLAIDQVCTLGNSLGGTLAIGQGGDHCDCQKGYPSDYKIFAYIRYKSCKLLSSNISDARSSLQAFISE